MAMKLDSHDMLPNENLIQEKAANAVIKVAERGLSDFAFNDFMWVAGMKGKEAMGGKLYLTNCRMIFKSHGFNRLKGKFSIFLPTIKWIRDSSHLMTRKIEVSTHTTLFEFVMWGIPDFIRRTNEQLMKITPESTYELREIALGNFDKCGEGLEIFGGLEKVNKYFLNVRKGSDILKIAKNPLQGLTALAFEELFDKHIVDRWQEGFSASDSP